MAIQQKSSNQPWILEASTFVALLLIAVHVFGIYKLATAKQPQGKTEQLKKISSRSDAAAAISAAHQTSIGLSVSSSSEEAESGKSDRFPTVSSLAHAMVQERLDQIIRERQERRYEERRRRVREESSNRLFVMVAMEKLSYNLREDFRESMMEMITANRISEPKDLRRLLNCYVSMNSEEFHGVILEVFHEVRR
ncbi:Ovate protein family, C-terminal [Cynara cardunculus var. scolymus]|uniref:Transcription repressor n=1 Tax=Cynara cardunculus var. scolymus TaxID=59895 RepID=A0A103Y236_CYNCS|nr:Ovate protein family, C-terminal [Cynara cardunculus var. scolymus]